MLPLQDFIVERLNTSALTRAELCSILGLYTQAAAMYGRAQRDTLGIYVAEDKVIGARAAEILLLENNAK